MKKDLANLIRKKEIYKMSIDPKKEYEELNKFYFMHMNLLSKDNVYQNVLKEIFKSPLDKILELFSELNPNICSLCDCANCCDSSDWYKDSDFKNDKKKLEG